MDPSKPCVGALFEIEKLEEIDSSLYGKVAWSIILNAIDLEGLTGSTDFFEGDTQATINGQEYVYCIALQCSDNSVITAFKQALDASDEFKRCVHALGFVEGSQLYSEPLIHSAHVKGGHVEVKTGSPLRYALAAAKKAQREAQTPEAAVVPERTCPASQRTAKLPPIKSLDTLKNYLERTFPKNSAGFWFFITAEELCDIAEATQGVLHFHWDEPEHGGMSGDEIEVTVTEAFKHDNEDESEVSTLRFSGLAAFASNADAVGWCRKNNFSPSLWGVEGNVATKLMGSEGNTLWSWEKEEFRDREVAPDELWRRFCLRRQQVGCSVGPSTSPQTVADDDAPAARPTDSAKTQTPPTGQPVSGRMIDTTFEMTVDDVFAIKGRGTVATGRIAKGYIRVGDALTIRRSNGRITNTVCDAVEMFRTVLTAAKTGDDVGIILRGVTPEGVERGDVLVSTTERQPLLAKELERKPQKACFVATACFGNAEAPEVLELRDFRDSILETHVLGRLAVRLYYTFSPPVARWLSRRPRAARVMRERVLMRLVKRIQLQRNKAEQESGHVRK